MFIGCVATAKTTSNQMELVELTDSQLHSDHQFGQNDLLPGVDTPQGH